MQQFVPPSYDLVERMHSVGSQSTAITSLLSLGKRSELKMLTMDKTCLYDGPFKVFSTNNENPFEESDSTQCSDDQKESDFLGTFHCN